MPPTDCFGDSEAGSSSLSCSVPEQQQQQQQQQPEQQRGLLPTARSPMHHGTDPDLSALTPLPPGVAATGLDLSPVTASSCSLMAKRKKQRGSPARGLPASVPGGLASRGSLSAAARPGPQVRRAATLMPFGSAQRPLSYPSPTAAAAPSSSTSFHPSSSGSSSRADSAINSSNPSGGASDGSPLFNARQAWHRHADATTSSGAAMDEQDRDEGQTPDVPSQVHRFGTGRPCAVGSGVKNQRGGLQPPAVEAEHQQQADDEDEDGLAPPGLVPLTRGGGGQAACAVASSGGCAADSGSESGSRSSSGGGDAQRREKQLALKSMMDKAKMASENIRLLLHAKRCDGVSCKEPGCESARQLVKHMRNCRSPGGAGCNAKCVQAQKMLRHYADCNRKRALGGRYCLVCSLVARSAMSGNSAQNAGDANATPSSVYGRNRAVTTVQGRQPLGHLAPSAAAGAGPRQQTNGGCCGGGGRGTQKNHSRGVGAGGVPSPVAITRLRRSDMGQRQVRDGVFFRPLPKTRRGSWGGYDRCRYLRRTRFDSIPEELAEEECDEDDIIDQQAASDGGSKPTDDASRSKTLVTAHSL